MDLVHAHLLAERRDCARLLAKLPFLNRHPVHMRPALRDFEDLLRAKAEGVRAIEAVNFQNVRHGRFSFTHCFVLMSQV